MNVMLAMVDVSRYARILKEVIFVNVIKDTL